MTADASLVHTLTPALAFVAWPDDDGDALVFDWQLAADEQFDAPLASGRGQHLESARRDGAAPRCKRDTAGRAEARLRVHVCPGWFLVRRRRALR